MTRQYLADKLYYSTVQIIGNNKTGTAFFYIHDFGGMAKIFLVTNRHVITDNNNGAVLFHASRSPYPTKELDVSNCVTWRLNSHEWENKWKFHPDSNIDIAILDFTEVEAILDSKKEYIYYNYISNNTLISEEDLPDISGIENVVFVGYPKGLIDSANLLPIARHGFTATPIKNDFNKEKKFLIDASVFPGSSGSPVCILNEGTPFIDRNNTLRIDATRFIFLGVLSSVHVDLNPDESTKEHLDLGVVTKGITVTETINHHFTIRTQTGA